MAMGDRTDQSFATFIFDDDGPGEIVDVVAIRLTENLVSVTLFHCKFSSGDMPGARVKDLYAVRGQAQKSARWRDRPTACSSICFDARNFD
jgi:hypothetical protein